MKTKTLIMLACWLTLLSAQAKTIYVSQNGAGFQNGMDYLDAYPLTWPNTSGNWNGGGTTILAGDTITLVGTITNYLSILGSGTVASPITVTFFSGAIMSSPQFTANGAIEGINVSNIVIDGAGIGVIQNTANGTGLTYSNDSVGIVMQSVTNLTIKNLTITNIYHNISGDSVRNGGEAMELSGTGITVTNCNLSDGDAVLVYNGPQPGNPTWGNIYIVNDRILNYNHGIAIGVGNGNASGQNCLLTNLVIAGCYLDHSDVFDDTNGAHHMDSLYLVGETYDPTVVIRGFYVYGNTWGPHVANTNFASTQATAIIGNYFAYPAAQLQNWYIYNNLVTASIGNSWGNPFLGAGSNVWFVNNTVLNGNQFGAVGTNVYSYNNLGTNGSGPELGGTAPTNTITGANTSTNTWQAVNIYCTNSWSDYNVFAGPQPVNGTISIACACGGGLLTLNFPTLTYWQTYVANTWGWPTPVWNAAHCDPHSTTNVPVFNVGSYVPALTDTVARQQGTNLTFLGITTDMLGISRPPTGNWDIGAYQSSSVAVQATGSLRISGAVSLQ